MFGGPLGAIKNVMATGDTSSIPFPFALATFVNCSTWCSSLPVLAYLARIFNLLEPPGRLKNHPPNDK